MKVTFTIFSNDINPYSSSKKNLTSKSLKVNRYKGQPNTFIAKEKITPICPGAIFNRQSDIKCWKPVLSGPRYLAAL